MTTLRTIEWITTDSRNLYPGMIRMIDQTLLPEELTYIETADIDEIWDAIKMLKVRGAPAIGIAAAMGLAAGVQNSVNESSELFLKEVKSVADYLASSRPTAVNLFWALSRMSAKAESVADLSLTERKRELIKEAMLIRDEDAGMCRNIGEAGADLISDGDSILTHCNAGGLATSELGTALSPMYVAKERGINFRVFADETRPLLQGSRLTAWELMQGGIDVTLICDNMAAHTMKSGKITKVFVGSDRIAANGDAANKIGTYGVALLAKAHNIPFYVLAPTSTIDLETATGDEIPIEEREKNEIIRGFGKLTAPEEVKIYSPAFDVTPAELITGIICEKGILYPNPDYRSVIASAMKQ